MGEEREEEDARERGAESLLYAFHVDVIGGIPH